MPRGYKKSQDQDMSAARGNVGHARATRANQFRIPGPREREIMAPVPADLSGHVRTRSMAAKWLNMLSSKSRGTGWAYGPGQVVKGSVKFRRTHHGRYRGTYSLPTMEAMFNDYGQYTGHSSSIKTMGLYAGGAIESPFEYIGRGFTPGMTPGQLSGVVSTAMGQTRWDPIVKAGQPFTPIPGMHRHQYQVDLGGGLPERALPAEQMLRTFFTARAAAKRQFGVGLHIDVAKETSLAAQQFSAYRASDVSVFGGLYKGGYKMLQRQRTIPMTVSNAMRQGVRGAPGQFGFGDVGGDVASRMMFHGRMLETGMMYDLRNIDPRTRTDVLSRRSPIGALNTTHRFLLGERAAGTFSDVDQAIHATSFQSMLARGTRPNRVLGSSHRGFGTGTSYHGFITKTNLVGTAGASQLGAGVMRPFMRTDPAFVLEAMMGTFQLGMMRQGRSKSQIMKAMRMAVGAGNLRGPGAGGAAADLGGRVVTKGFSRGKFTGAGRLFDIDLPENWLDLTAAQQGEMAQGWQKQQLGAMRGVISRFSKASGMGMGDLERMGLITRGAGGNITEFMSFGGVAQREHDMYSWGSSMGKGLNPYAGLRVTQDMIWTAKSMGATGIADYMDAARRDPVIAAHLKFRNRGMAAMAHLTQGGTAAAVGGTIPMSQLLGGKTTQFSAFFSQMHTTLAGQGSGDIFDTTNAAAMLQQFAKKEGLTDLGSLFTTRGTGFMVDLGGAREVATSINIKNQTQFAQGTLSALPIANIAAGGGDDYAYTLARFLAKGPGDPNALNRMVGTLLPAYTGGRGGFYSNIFAPKLGQAVSARIQNPASISGRGAERSFDAMVRKHLAGYGQKFDPGANYIMADRSMLGRLDPETRALAKRTGTVRGLAQRWPETGRSIGSARFLFTDNKRLRGRGGFMMKSGVASMMLGDVDADEMTAVFANQSDRKFMDALVQMERVQGKPHRMQQRLKSAAFRREAMASGKTFTGMVSALFGLAEPVPGGAVEQELLKATPGAQLAGTLAAQSTKTLTPMVDPLVKLKAASWVTGVEQGVVTASAAERRMAGEFIPAMIETAISKHKGTDTHQAIMDLNDSIKARASAVIAGEADDIVGAYRNILATSMAEFSGGKQAGPFASVLGEFGAAGKTLRSQMLRGTADTAAFHTFLSTQQGTDLIQKLAKTDLYGLQAKEALAGLVGPAQKVFGAEDIKNLQTSVFAQLPTSTNNPLYEAIGNLRGLDMVATEEYAAAGGAGPTARSAAKAQAQAAELATGGPLKDRARSLYGDVVDWAFNTAKMHKGKTAAGAMVLGGVAALAGLHSISNVVGRSDHVANQPEPMTRTPHTQYVLGGFDAVGYDLTMTGSAGPEALLFARGTANQMANGADVRIMDSRTSLSDTSLGRMAQDKTDSIYSRSII